MLAAILITLAVVAAILLALRPSAGGGLITRTPYNNPHSDASAARDDRRA